MNDDFPSRLAAAIHAGRAAAVIGLDPRPQALPAAIDAGPAPARISAFYRRVLPRLAPHVAAVKPNVAFFERFGADGFQAYEDTCHLAKELGLLVIGDVKRGDIGSTAEAYAEVHLALADAVTVQPWLGRDGVQPFLDRCREGGRGVFVLVRTSNPSADDVQGISTAEGPVWEVVARTVERWGKDLGDPNGYSPVGAVAGATRAADLPRVRELMPRAWLLLPGVGAQGATVADAAAAFDAGGLGALVSQSRGVMQAFRPDDPDWEQAIERAAVAFAGEVRAVAARRKEASRP